MGTYTLQVYLEQVGPIKVGYLPQGYTKIFLVEMMFEVLSAMTSAKRDKLDTTVDRSPTDERNTAPSRFEESTPKSIFRKGIKNLTQAIG